MKSLYRQPLDPSQIEKSARNLFDRKLPIRFPLKERMGTEGGTEGEENVSISQETEEIACD